MDFLYHIFYACQRLRLLDVETNPGPRRHVPDVCRILCSNVWGLAVASSLYDILLCFETLISDMRHVSELLVPWFGRPVLLCWGKMPRARGMAAYVRDGYRAFRQPKFECGWCEMLFFRVCGVRQNLCVFSLYRNPDLDDRIFLLFTASIAAVEAEDTRASFLFVGDLNGHHQEWLGSITTNRHGVAAINFATFISQLRSLVRIAVVAPIGNSDHSTLSAVISMVQAVPNLCVSRKVYLKHQVNCNTVCCKMY